MRTSASIAASAMAAMLGAVANLAGCARQEVPPPVLAATLPDGLRPEASILDLMTVVIDPNAAGLWDSVAVIDAAGGSANRHPATEAAWLAVRHQALLLVESANLLVVEGRPVAHPGQLLAEPGAEGDLTPADAQVAIDRDRAAFVRLAGALQVAAGQLLQAIDKRDSAAFQVAGKVLDEACEGCHRRFWYPERPLSPGDRVNPPSASR